MRVKQSFRWWLSWVQPTEDFRPMTDPPDAAIIGWWCSGYNGNGNATLCALVTATTMGGAKAAIRRSWPEAPSKRTEWRIENQNAADWLPGDRFPLTGWMLKRAKSGDAP